MVGFRDHKVSILIECEAEWRRAAGHIQHRARCDAISIDRIGINNVWALVRDDEQPPVRAERYLRWIAARVAGRRTRRARNWRQGTVLTDAEAVDGAAPRVQ